MTESLNMAILTECVALHEEKAALAARLKELVAEITVADSAVLDELIRCGMPRVTVGDRTLAPRRQLWAGRGEGLTADDFFDRLGRFPALAGYATHGCNTQGFSEHVRSIEGEMEASLRRPITSEELSAEIEARYPGLGPVKLSERNQISVTKAAATKVTALSRAAARKSDMTNAIGEGPIA